MEPQPPSAEQYQKLIDASALQTMGDPKPLDVHDGRTTLRTSLPRQAVSLFVITW